MSDQLCAASRETAYRNARALCNDIDAEMIYPAFDVALDMACRLNDILQASRTMRNTAPDTEERPQDAPEVQQRAASRSAR